MSVVINTSASATFAANNLAASNRLLQKSLNQLSSGSRIVDPADDAGGLAVAMKLSTTAKRQRAVSSNIANAVSLLQTQDGVLSVTGKILSRIGELQALYSDVTKGSSDRANYDSEFAGLQRQLTANGGEQFNGVALFGTNDLAVPATENGAITVTIQGINMLTPPLFPPFYDRFVNLNNWTDQSSGTFSPSSSVAGNILSLTVPGQTVPGIGLLPPMYIPGTGSAAVQSNGTFFGPFAVYAEIQFGGGTNSAHVKFGSTDLASLTDGADITDPSWHQLWVSYDGAGNAYSFLDESYLGAASGIGINPAAISLENTGDGNTNIRNLDIWSTPPQSNVANIVATGSLAYLSQSTVSNAISDVASYRAQNGANQSQLGYSSELLSANQANLEAATSRITDVDVAAASTSLARFTVLMQAGTAMLSQANQSAQSVLKLLG